MFEMKSCPFCNSFNFTCNVSLNEHKRAIGLQVNCLDCGTTFILEEPVYGNLNFERYDAIDVWNGRERKNG